MNNNVIEADTKVVSTPFDDWRQGKVGNKWGRVPTFQLWRFQSPTWRFQRFTPFSSARKIVAIYAESQINRPYGYLKLIPHFLDAMISKVTGGNPYLFRRLLFIANYPICSWVWGYAYDQVGLSLGGDPRSQAPDDQLDYVIKNRFDQDLGINGNWKRIM